MQINRMAYLGFAIKLHFYTYIFMYIIVYIVTIAVIYTTYATPICFETKKQWRRLIACS